MDKLEFVGLRAKACHLSQICVFATLLQFSALNAANQVVINSKADEAFLVAREDVDTGEPITYVFMKGRFHGGNRADPAMDAFPFDEVILDIATHLQKQNFNPVPDPDAAEMVIVVHYGVTTTQESQEDLLGYTSLEDYEFQDIDTGGSAATGADLEAIQNYQFNVNSSIAIQEGNQGGMFYNARLLGMEEAFDDHGSPHEEYLLKSLLSDRRYFIVLMAYDLPLMRKGEVHMHWTTRYSIRAIGQTFDQAIKDMNLVAGNYFGENMGELVKKHVTDKSRVKMGKIEVISSEENLDEPQN